MSVLNSSAHCSDTHSVHRHVLAETTVERNTDAGDMSSDEDTDTGAKLNPFDWSEQPQVNRVASNGEPRQFNTVHGRQGRGLHTTKSSHDRAPSGPHARSRSVPVLNDHNEPRANPTSKFATWGVGVPPASEEWDNDFDLAASSAYETLVQNSVSFVIPESILEGQSAIRANIVHIREWAILIEELKELRLKAILLGVDQVKHEHIFAGIESMIALADQEEQNLLKPPVNGASSSLLDDVDLEDFDHFSETSSPVKTTHPRLKEVKTRPRNNSEVTAKQVISVVQRVMSSGHEADSDSAPTPAAGKLPFDQGTLKHMIPHLNGLITQLKSVLKEVEGIERQPAEPLVLKQVFRPLGDEDHIPKTIAKTSNTEQRDNEEEDWTAGFD